MSIDLPPPEWSEDAPLVVARGSHVKGYFGVVRQWVCRHNHATTIEARACAYDRLALERRPRFSTILLRTDWLSVWRKATKRRDRRVALAAAYAVAAEQPMPIRAIAAALGLRPGQVRDAVHDARVAGLLTPTQPRSAGGTLTPKGARLARELVR